jgi:hypothetical protein
VKRQEGPTVVLVKTEEWNTPVATARPSSSDDDDDDDDDSAIDKLNNLSSGALAGVVIGILVAIVALIAGCCYAGCCACCGCAGKKRRKKAVVDLEEQERVRAVGLELMEQRGVKRVVSEGESGKVVSDPPPKYTP